MATDQRWVFGHALNVENPHVGTFVRNTLYSKLTLESGTPLQDNWLMAAVPAPNVTEGWRVSYVMLRLSIRGHSGGINHIGVRDGDQTVGGFEEDIVGTPGWQTLSFPIYDAAPIKFGLGVSIHAYVVPTPIGPTEFLFAGVGLQFFR